MAYATTPSTFAMPGDTLYRYEDDSDARDGDHRPVLTIWTVDRQTARGLWITQYRAFGVRRCWMSSYALVPFAYPSREEAARAYLRKKEAHVWYAAKRFQRASALFDSALSLPGCESLAPALRERSCSIFSPFFAISRLYAHPGYPDPGTEGDAP